LGYIREKKEQECQRNKGGSLSMARFASVTRNEREALEFQAKGGGKNACFPWKWALGRKILVEIRMFFVI
jgi:hypothetical protein